MVQGEINRGRHTDHPAGCHSIQTNQCLPPPSPRPGRKALNGCSRLVVAVVFATVSLGGGSQVLCSELQNKTQQESESETKPTGIFRSETHILLQLMSFLIEEHSSKHHVVRRRLQPLPTLKEIIFGRPFVKRFALCYRTVVCPVCLSVCNVGVFWPNGWMDRDDTWHGGRPRPRPHCVR